MNRREFLKKAGFAGLGTVAVFVAPSFTTIRARAAYEAMTQATPTPRPPAPTPTPQATSTPGLTPTPPTATPATNPGMMPGDVVVGPPTVSYYTWNTDGCYYRNHFGKRELVVCSPNGPGSYVFPDGWRLED